MSDKTNCRLIEICNSDNLHAFNDYLQAKLQLNDNLILQEEVLQAILSTKNIYSALITEYSSENKLFVHPLLCNILNFALAYFKIYERRVFEILDFGISHNLNISKQLNCDCILQNGNLIKSNQIIGRVLVYNATEAIDGTDKLFMQLNELNNSIKAIKTKQFNLAGGYSGLSVRYIDGIVEKERTFNEFEYSFLRLMEENGYSKTPKYLGVKNGKDIFSYIKGDAIPYTYEMGEKTIIAITKELRIINDISKAHLDGKVYVHGDLGTQNVVFDNGKIVGIIDWDNTFIGEEYEDFIYIFWTWANVGNLQRNNERMFSLLKIMINTYQPDENFKRNFADKILQRMERKLKHTPINSNTYKRIYAWVKWSEEWVKQFADKISLEIG